MSTDARSAADPHPVARLLPGLTRLRHYERAWLRPDVLAGITVAAYLVPQVMAYAEVAGLPAVAGLWAIMGPLLVYALLGSSRQLSVGPESTTALMTATAIAPLAAGDPSTYAALAAALALLVAAFCLAAWAGRLGFLADLLSKPVLIGYLTGVALIMIVGQLGKVTGVPVEGDTFVAEMRSFLANIGDLDWTTLALAAGVLAFLLLTARRWPKAPVPLIGVIVATVVVWVLDLQSRGVAVVGPIPAGVPVPHLPDVGANQLASLLLPAVGVAIVGYTDNVLTARAFANRNGYQIDANQELLALGTSNAASGLMSGFPVSSSGSRTVIGDSLGSRSQLYSLVALASVIVVLLFLRPFLAEFPTAALGAIVIYAALRLIELSEFRRFARFRRSELVLAVATTVGVLVVDILYGVLLAVALSIVDLLRRVARPHDGILGYAPGVPGMHDVDDYPDAVQVPGLVVYRYDSPLFFANAEDFKTRALESLHTAHDPVEWFVLNAEANVEIDITSIDAIGELREELEARGVVFVMARVKQDLRDDLRHGGLVETIGEDHLFPTLPTAVRAYFQWYEQSYGHPPPGVSPPIPTVNPVVAQEGEPPG